MHPAKEHPRTPTAPPLEAVGATFAEDIGPTFRAPTTADGIRLWEIARDSKVLDVNSSYAYVLWCRDFTRTSAVCEVDGTVAGFVTGYLRPDQPDTLFVWQVAVDEDFRGQGIALGMLAWLFEQATQRGATHLETTISPSNTASQALFRSLARQRNTDIIRQPLFDPSDFTPPAESSAGTGGNNSTTHEAEDLYTVGNRRL